MPFELLNSVLEAREISSKESAREIKGRLATYHPEITISERNGRATLNGKGWRVEMSMQLKHAFDVSVFKQKGLLKKEWVEVNFEFTDGINDTVQFILKTLKGEW